MLGTMSRVFFVPMFAALASAALGAFVGCEPIQENVPDVSGFNVNRPTAPPSNPNGDGGTTGGAFDPKTYCNGGPIAFEAVGTCDVSFAADIMPLVNAGSGACGAGGCHATVTDKLPNPLGGGATPAQVWQTLVSFQLYNPAKQPIPYIDICSTDPARSAITCNLDFEAGKSCGTPMPDGTPLPPANRELIATWLACGAPLN